MPERIFGECGAGEYIMTEFIMLVGIPASGKSTYAHELEKQGYHIYSSDAIRKELTGDSNSQNINNKVFKILHKRIKDDLKNGISCVYDATNTSMKRRIAFLNEIKKYECRKKCVLFVMPVEICKERNQTRERKVPDSVFDKMLKQFQCPYYYEGWDEIEIEWYDGDVKPIEIDLNMNQDNKHHSLTLGEHMKKTREYVLNRINYPRMVFFAAGIHDIGKLYTKSFTDSKGNPSEDAHYYGHENYGAYMFLVMQNYGISIGEHESAKTSLGERRNILYISSLINWHMRPHTAWKQSEKARKRDKMLIGEDMYDDIMLLHEADLAAH